MTDPARTTPAPRTAVRVHLPRSLVALFPGGERQVDVAGSTVREVIDALEKPFPGIRDRLIDAGPAVRTHLNVYVAGERATLDTEVAPGSDVHIVPAVSGGQ
ncbi:MAG: MoaD/ThiS family protein [Chloroflexota bacterium]